MGQSVTTKAAQQVHDKNANLKQKLGYKSAPFPAKYAGMCLLSGVKIKTGDILAFYNTPLNGKGPCHKIAIDLKEWNPTLEFNSEIKERINKYLEEHREKKGSE